MQMHGVRYYPSESLHDVRKKSELRWDITFKASSPIFGLFA